MSLEDNSTTRKFFQQIALLGPAIFLERLVPKEKIELEYLQFNQKNAKNFLLLKLLTEVQKTGFVFSRWNSFRESNTWSDAGSVNDQILETFIDEQSLWQRKLMEGLVLLINFSSTNELPFYYHLLLLRELEHYRGILQEQKDFFTHGSTLTEKTEELLTKRIQTVEDGIEDLSRCWYLPEQKPIRKRKPRPVISSMRKQLKRAFSVAIHGEKTAMAYTYGQSYGETSGNIHFNIIRLDYTDLRRRFSFGFSQCGLLAVSILQRAHILTGLEPEGINRQLMRLNRNVPTKTNPTVPGLEKGDFVLANGPYLGEVLDVEINKFGYKTYLVKYLQETPFEGIEEDWFPSFEIQLFMKRCKMVRDVLAELKKEAHEHGDRVPQFSEKEVHEATRNAVVEIWCKGIREHIKRTIIPRRKGDQGMGYDPLKEDS
ncbi:MAG: hypothetical protein NT096_08070 [Proteobacteria bacterium]|nr:hypothetical protein [Pseudomonadota bacterium]